MSVTLKWEDSSKQSLSFFFLVYEYAKCQEKSIKYISKHSFRISQSRNAFLTPIKACRKILFTWKPNLT